MTEASDSTERPRRSPGSAARTAAAAVVGLGLVLGMRLGWIAPLPTAGPERWGTLYRRAGDAFVRMTYLAGAQPGSGPGRRLLGRAAGYYLLSVSMKPLDKESAVSLALVLHALKRRQEARAILADVAGRPQPQPEKKALSAALITMVSTRPKPEQVMAAEAYLNRLAPGPLLLAGAYETIGEVGGAERQRELAEEQGRRIIPGLVAVLATCGVLLLAGIGGLVVVVVGLARPREPGPQPTPPAWGVREAVEALIVWVALATAAGGLLARWGLLPRDLRGGGAALAAPSLVAGCGAMLWIWAVTRGRARFGWALGRAGRSAALGIAIGGLAAPIILVVAQLLQLALGPEEHRLVPAFVTDSDWGSRFALVAATLALVPLIEETLFRGVLFRSLRAVWPFWAAAGASALIFAVGHMSWPALLPYFLVGLVLARLYERTGSLLAPAVTHAAFNAFNLAIIMFLFGG